MSDIKLNTDTLRDYGNQIINISGRVVDVNLKLKSLYWNIPLVDIGKLLRADKLADFNSSLIGAANYCYGTADEFDNLETKLCSQNPLDFNKPPLAGIQEFLYDAALAVGCAVQVGIELIVAVEIVKWKIIDSAIDFIVDHGIEILGVVGSVAAIASGVLLFSLGPVGWVLGALVIAFAVNDIWTTFTGNNLIRNGLVSVLGEDLGGRVYSIGHLGATITSIVVPGAGAAAALKAVSTGAKAVKATKALSTADKILISNGVLKAPRASIATKVANAAGKSNTAKEALKVHEAIDMGYVSKGMDAKTILEDIHGVIFNKDISSETNGIIKNVVKANARAAAFI